MMLASPESTSVFFIGLVYWVLFSTPYGIHRGENSSFTMVKVSSSSSSVCLLKTLCQVEGGEAVGAREERRCLALTRLRLRHRYDVFIGLP